MKQNIMTYCFVDCINDKNYHNFRGKVGKTNEKKGATPSTRLGFHFTGGDQIQNTHSYDVNTKISATLYHLIPLRWLKLNAI